MPGYEQYLEFIMDEVAIGQDFLTTLRSSPVNIIAPRLHIRINISPNMYNFSTLKYRKRNIHTLILSLPYVNASQMVSKLLNF